MTLRKSEQELAAVEFTPEEREQLELMLSTQGWTVLLQTIMKKAKVARSNLITNPRLTEDIRQVYIGELAGIYRALQIPYIATQQEVPNALKTFFRGE